MRHEPPHKILDYASASFVRILVAVFFFFARVLHGGEFQDFQVSGQQFEERVNSLKFVEIYDLVFNLREDLR